MITFFQGKGAAVDRKLKCLAVNRTIQHHQKYHDSSSAMANTGNFYPFPMGPDPFPTDKPNPRHGSTNKQTRCKPCFERKGTAVFHRHFSAQYYEKNTILLGETMNCPTCKIVHDPKSDEARLVVIYSASTLHNVALDPAVRTQFHVNLETLCGAKMGDLYQDWVATYGSMKTPMDVIVVATANDVPNTSPKDYENILNNWTFKVWNSNPSNTFRICKMLRPPAKVWLPRNGPLPPNYINYIEEFNELNRIIDKQNLMNVSSPVIGFNNEGCRTSRKRKREDGTTSGELSHIFSQWREFPQGKHRGYHLNDQNRVLMLKRLLKYIEYHIINLQM